MIAMACSHVDESSASLSGGLRDLHLLAQARDGALSVVLGT